jgi:hypothetical protein
MTDEKKISRPFMHSLFNDLWLKQTSPIRKNCSRINIYVCNLWVHYMAVDNCTVMCMWPENFASWGSSEVSYCLFKVLTKPQDIINKTNCHCFSDSCCERNKNNVIYTLFCATVCTEMSLEINHSFLMHGHTFLPSDRHLWTYRDRRRRISPCKTCQG